MAPKLDSYRPRYSRASRTNYLNRNCVSAERFPQRSPSRGVSCPNYSNYADSTQPQPLDYQGPGEHCADDHGAVTTTGYWAAAAAVPAGREGESEIVGGEYCAGSAQPYPTGHPGPGEHYADDRGAAAPAGYWAAAAALTEERDDGYNMIGGFTRA